jgi:hypothetical protein
VFTAIARVTVGMLAAIRRRGGPHLNVLDALKYD